MSCPKNNLSTGGWVSQNLWSHYKEREREREWKPFATVKNISTVKIECKYTTGLKKKGNKKYTHHLSEKRLKIYFLPKRAHLWLFTTYLEIFFNISGSHVFQRERMGCSTKMIHKILNSTEGERTIRIKTLNQKN